MRYEKHDIKFGFFEKFEIIPPFTNKEGIEGILSLIKRYHTFQYVLGDVSGLLRFLLNSWIDFSSVAKIILVHSFVLASAFVSQYFIILIISYLLNWSVLLIKSLQFLSSSVGPYNTYWEQNYEKRL